MSKIFRYVSQKYTPGLIYTYPIHTLLTRNLPYYYFQVQVVRGVT